MRGAQDQETAVRAIERLNVSLGVPSIFFTVVECELIAVRVETSLSPPVWEKGREERSEGGADAQSLFGRHAVSLVLAKTSDQHLLVSHSTSRCNTVSSSCVFCSSPFAVRLARCLSRRLRSFTNRNLHEDRAAVELVAKQPSCRRPLYR